MDNRIIAIVLADGEIFSNLKFTQRLYDALVAENAINPPDPIHPDKAVAAAEKLLPELLQEDGVVQNQVLSGSSLEEWLRELAASTITEEGTRILLQGAFASSQAYHESWLTKKGKK